MSEDITPSSFPALREQYFDALSTTLGLGLVAVVDGDGFAIVSAAAGYVRVFFEHDRGLCHFSVGSSTESKPLCSVEELAVRFPRIRLLPEGWQRLNLEEQRAFLESRWQDLQVMFSPEHLPETRKWRQAAATSYTKQFARGS